MAETLKKITEANWFGNSILLLIGLASILVGLETSPSIMASYGGIIHFLDNVILWAFAAEMVMKMGAQLPKPWAYFKDGWNVFDFFIVAMCFMPLEGQFVAVLRLARILRALRLVKALPRLRLIVNALLSSFSSMGYVGLLLFIIFYMYSIIAVFIFGSTDPANFGSIPKAFLTLFQIVTLEGWADLMTPHREHYPIVTPIFFVSFILLGTMIVLNLFIGVIVNGMSEAQEEAHEEHLREVAIAKAELTPEEQFEEWQKKMTDLQDELGVIRLRMERRLKQNNS